MGIGFAVDFAKSYVAPHSDCDEGSYWACKKTNNTWKIDVHDSSTCRKVLVKFSGATVPTMYRLCYGQIDALSRGLWGKDFSILAIEPFIAKVSMPAEKPCKACSRMNDVGIKICWCCGNNPD